MLHKKKHKEKITVDPIIIVPVEEVKEEKITFKPVLNKWIINPDKQVLAGKIREVRKDNTILWEDSAKTLIESKVETFINENYQCVELEPEMLRWKIL